MENLQNVALSIESSRHRRRSRTPCQPRLIPPNLNDAPLKNHLQEETQNEDPSLPVHSVEILGTPQCRIFRASVVVKGGTFSHGQCFSRKATKQLAAKEAYIYAKAVGFDPTLEESLRSEKSNLSAKLVQEVANTQRTNEEISLLKHEVLSLTSQLEQLTSSFWGSCDAQVDISSRFIVDHTSAMLVYPQPLLSGQGETREVVHRLWKRISRSYILAPFYLCHVAHICLRLSMLKGVLDRLSLCYSSLGPCFLGG
ncbi:hypothetical protein AMTR_s00085p00095960 [Amborella trichopoda]|uniref:DRBM domain-containing protein n=1 Tax=Amborella trichopoda TaxID=13333 RepID=W1P6U6_AMBTC|nr:hypothetical protein AMTR_s00085p00095960 [Amborella trichopoda]